MFQNRRNRILRQSPAIRDLVTETHVMPHNFIAPLLRAAGVGVLLASLPAGPLRRAAGALLAPLGASAMVGALAQSLVARTLLLAEQAGASSVAAPIDAVVA